MLSSSSQRLVQGSRFSRESGNATPIFVIVALIAIGLGIYIQTGQKQSAAQLELKKTILLPQPKALGPVSFVDHHNQTFDIKRLQGKWSILFFGFTNCPDICPSTMQTLKLVKQRVEQANAWNSYQVIMVSVDPERDSIERLNNYVPFFDEDFVGIRADLEQTTAFAKSVGILFFKGEPAANGGYDVDHGASLILLNPEGNFAGVISAPHKVEEISSDLITMANQGGWSTVTNDKQNQSNKPNSNAPESNSPLTFDNAWIRPAPPGATSMAAYFEVSNNTEKDIIIVDSDSPAFRMTMVHETAIENDVASMRHLPSLTIPAGETISLAPLGTHMMLMGAKKPLSLGDTAELTLIDQRGERHTKTVEVRQLETP